MTQFLFNYAGYIAIILLFLFMVLGVPVFASMALATLLASLLVQPPIQVFHTFAQNVWQGSSVFQLIALPLFLLTGTVMQQTDASRDLFAATRAWVGSISNSLGVATIVACGIFAAITGSSIATAATLGLVAVPLLQEEGYGKERASGFVAGGGTLGIIIPPSIPLILYGVITETSVGKLFIAGLIPGLLLLSMFGLYVYLSRPNIKIEHKISWTERRAVTKSGLGIFFLPALIIIAIYTGIFTPTEVGALAVIYVVLLGFAQGRLSPRKLGSAVVQATKTSCMLFMLIVFGQYFAHFLTFEYIPQEIASAIIKYAGDGIGAVTVVVFTYLVLGMFLESAAMLLISIPIFYPVAMHVGMTPLTFGIFACIAMEIAQISPPIGINLFTIHGVSKIPLHSVARGALPFLLIEICMLYVVYLVPSVTLLLPHSM